MTHLTAIDSQVILQIRPMKKKRLNCLLWRHHRVQKSCLQREETYRSYKRTRNWNLYLRRWWMKMLTWLTVWNITLEWLPKTKIKDSLGLPIIKVCTYNLQLKCQIASRRLLLWRMIPSSNTVQWRQVLSVPKRATMICVYWATPLIQHHYKDIFQEQAAKAKPVLPILKFLKVSHNKFATTSMK